MTASVRELHDAVWALLDAVVGVNAYDGEVASNPPLDDDGRVAAYAVLYVSPGSRYATSLDARQGALAGSFQVTCVGGDPTRTLWCVDAVRDALVGAVIALDGRANVIRATEGDPGVVRRDDAKQPPRHYVPLPFAVYIP